jgi:hypothetical protein
MSAEQGNAAKSGRKAGSVNYKPTVVIRLVNAALPASTVAWNEVAEQYQAETGRVTRGDDLKRYWIETLCDKFKKVTGSSAPAERVRQCQDIHRRLTEKECAMSMGFPPDYHEGLYHEVLQLHARPQVEKQQP